MEPSQGTEFGIVLGSNLFVPRSWESLTMAKASMLFLLLTSFWGCNAEFTMTQPPSVSASIGETVKISCTLNGEHISSTYNSWYQQKPGSAPVMLIDNNDDRASGISDRFSGSVDSSASTATLTISSCQAQVTLIQPPSVSASIGETANIFCTLNGDSMRDSDTFWYQEKPGSAPTLLIAHGSSRAPGISNRFSGSFDSSTNASILIISNVQPRDEADYLCYYFYSTDKRTMIQTHGEVRQKPLCSRCAVHWLCLADAPAESPVTSRVK
ncbi:UNVERIFIED_CONTAM: hypothetical protein K2H54_021971 [Gekko kuhli]